MCSFFNGDDNKKLINNIVDIVAVVGRHRFFQFPQDS